MLTGQSASSRGGGLDSSAHERVNWGGAGRVLLYTKANSSDWTASSGSEVGGSFGVGTLIGSSTLSLSYEALSAGTVVMDPSSPCPTFQDLDDNPSQVEGWGICGALVSLCRAHQGHSGMAGTPLKGHGQHNGFLTLHHSVILDSLEVLQGKIVPSPQHAQTGWSRPPDILFQLCGEQSESCSLPAGHPFDLNTAEALVLRVEKRSELPSPVGHPFVLLHVWADPLTNLVWVHLNPLPGSLCLLGRVAARCGQRRWRRKGTRSIRLLSGFNGPSINLLWGLCRFRDLWAFQKGCGLRVSNGLGSSPRRVASSSGVGEVPCSSHAGSKSKASTI